eukprot:3414227-Amphidinium_carterae.1
MESPDTMQRACSVAAEAVATIGELMLLGVELEEKLSASEKANKLRSAIRSLETQGETLGQNVKEGICPTIMQSFRDCIMRA